MNHSQEKNTSKYPLVVATSGHIDHGKTTLVKAITGIDTDNLLDEKKRGITIDLGFAHYGSSIDEKIAFIDVPGHEKFIHNMLAGMTGIDAVMLVVAADEGVMPQTREHLNICNLLKINDGLVVLTRIDLVEESGMVDLCREEIKELVEGTFLENKPIINVSAIKGYGVEKLINELLKLFNKNKSIELARPFRLNVDRSFSLKGFGTVVTGTVLSGSICKEDEVYQFPQDRSIRIRSIQTHGDITDIVYAGQRAALNLGGIKKDEINRGDQLADYGTLITSYMLNATFLLLDDTNSEIKNRTRIRLYLGGREVIGRIILLESDTLIPGEESTVQIRLESQISSKFGDRFIIRSFSPMNTLGGGMIVDPSPSKFRRIQRELPKRIRNLSNADPIIRSEEVIYLQSLKGLLESEFCIRSGLSREESRNVFQALTKKGKIFCTNNQTKRYIHAEHLERISLYITRIIADHHKNFIDRKGMTCAELFGKLRQNFIEREVENLLIYLVKKQKFKKSGEFFHLFNHRQQFSEKRENNISEVAILIKSGGYQPMRQSHLLEELKLDKKDGISIIKSALHSKIILNVAQDLYYTPEQIDEIKINLKYFLDENQSITVIQFKELLNISRKYAVDLLEYFDRKQLTIREGNFRFPTKKLSSKN